MFLLQTLGRSTMITAANGASLPAITVFSISLRYFRDHAIQELRDATGTKLGGEDIRWVITVPAIWRQQAKQFMREAAYQADIASPRQPDQLVIALEPEAASVYCRKLRLNQLVGDRSGRQEELEDSVLVMEEAGVGEDSQCCVLSCPSVLTVVCRQLYVQSSQ